MEFWMWHIVWPLAFILFFFLGFFSKNCFLNLECKAITSICPVTLRDKDKGRGFIFLKKNICLYQWKTKQTVAKNVVSNLWKGSLGGLRAFSSWMQVKVSLTCLAVYMNVRKMHGSIFKFLKLCSLLVYHIWFFCHTWFVLLCCDSTW